KAGERTLLSGLCSPGYRRRDTKAEKPEDRRAGRLCRGRGGSGCREKDFREGLCLYPGSLELCQCSGPLLKKADFRTAVVFLMKLYPPRAVFTARPSRHRAVKP